MQTRLPALSRIPKLSLTVSRGSETDETGKVNGTKQRTDGVLVTTERKGNVYLLATGYGPVLIGLVIDCTLNTTIDLVRDVSRYLREGEATVDHRD